MKKRTIIVLMIMAVITAMCFTACGKKAAPTLESYINDHPEVKSEIDEQMGTEGLQGVTIEFSGNEMVYNFDLASMQNVTEEVAKSEETKAALDQGLEAQSATFVNVANTILDTLKQDGAEIETVQVTVNYKYGDELITTRTFDADPNAAPAVDAEEPAEDAVDAAEDAAEGAAEDAADGAAEEAEPAPEG